MKTTFTLYDILLPDMFRCLSYTLSSEAFLTMVFTRIICCTAWAVDPWFIDVCSKSTVQHMILVKTMVKNAPDDNVYDRHRNMSGNKISYNVKVFLLMHSAFVGVFLYYEAFWSKVINFSDTVSSNKKHFVLEISPILLRRKSKLF
jgi:hypothetical protein